MEVEDIERPLDPADAKDIADKWANRYDLDLHMYLDPADPLMSRLFREYRRNTASLKRPRASSSTIYRARTG